MPTNISGKRPMRFWARRLLRVQPGWRRVLLQMLQGQITTVIADLTALATHPKISKTAQKTLISVAAYYERNQTYMRYDQYLSSGWPIASGVIEGACRHLVKDRCELSGMR